MKPTRLWCLLASAALTLLPASPAVAQAQEPPKATSTDQRIAELRAAASEAYVFLYPLVTMDVTRRAATAPGDVVNRLSHSRAFPDASFRLVVRPNFDTLYSSSWIDLSGGPVVMRVPPSQGRYYLLQFLDMWTDSFAIPGTRTRGGEPQAFALVPPGWQGALPEGVARIDAPTDWVWLIGRTQTNGPADYAAVHRFQDAMSMEPLAAPARKTRQEMPLDLTIPPRILVDAMAPLEFLEYGAGLLQNTRPHETDWTQIERLKRLKIGTGLTFAPDKLSKAEIAAINAGIADARRALSAREAGLNPESNGWSFGTEGIGVYGNSYLRRAIVARRGLGANPPEDAVYLHAYRDTRGHGLQGGRGYAIRFEKGQLPPADAFWSVTLYDGEGFPVANPIGRHALGDRDRLQFNPDGSLEILIQPDDPGGALSGNWLPSPASGAITLSIRIYLPREEVLSRRWTPPTVNPL